MVKTALKSSGPAARLRVRYSAEFHLHAAGRGAAAVLHATAAAANEDGDDDSDGGDEQEEQAQLLERNRAWSYFDNSGDSDSSDDSGSGTSDDDDFEDACSSSVRLIVSYCVMPHESSTSPDRPTADPGCLLRRHLQWKMTCPMSSRME